MQFIGSIVACASIGNSYTAAKLFAADLTRRRGSPSCLAERPALAAAAAFAEATRIAALSSARVGALVPGDFQRIARLQRLPEVLGHDDDAARRASARGARPASPRPRRSRRMRTRPPSTGHCAIAAYSMPGSVTSSPNTALPSTLPGVSSRGMRGPDQLKSALGLSATSFGTLSFAAAWASSP